MTFSEFDYTFKGERWTVGRLRQALAGYDDDTPVMVLAEFEPATIDEYVIIDGGLLGETVVPTIRPETDEFVLLCKMNDEAPDQDADGEEP